MFSTPMDYNTKSAIALVGEKNISKISCVVERQITTDECTSRKLQILYARVLVEVDIIKPMK